MYMHSKTILQPHLFFIVCETWKLPISVISVTEEHLWTA